METKTVQIHKALLNKFAWDARSQAYSCLVPMIRPAWAGVSAPQYRRYRVELRAEGYAVLIPTTL
ncbi:hypothetical protein PSAC2689_30535 [Paraburkholderia sacchari]|uniref:hypothetical protein n=1 Tax=Paraburkholderia sacchari TaxID=159450 RepID=UPI0039A4D891